MNDLIHNLVLDILCAVALIVLGILMFIYRNEIGAFTGYYTGRGGHVNKTTPGWLLIPFALALVVVGLAVILRSMLGW